MRFFVCLECDGWILLAVGRAVILSRSCDELQLRRIILVIVAIFFDFSLRLDRRDDTVIGWKVPVVAVLVPLYLHGHLTGSQCCVMSGLIIVGPSLKRVSIFGENEFVRGGIGSDFGRGSRFGLMAQTNEATASLGSFNSVGPCTASWRRFEPVESATGPPDRRPLLRSTAMGTNRRGAAFTDPARGRWRVDLPDGGNDGRGLILSSLLISSSEDM